MVVEATAADEREERDERERRDCCRCEEVPESGFGCGGAVLWRWGDRLVVLFGGVISAIVPRDGQH